MLEVQKQYFISECQQTATKLGKITKNKIENCIKKIAEGKSLLHWRKKIVNRNML